MRENFLSRTRKFTPQNFFTSILHLATSTNKEGYDIALHRAWIKSGLMPECSPNKSSLCELRAKVSSDFFKDIYEEDLREKNKHRKTYRGHFIYSVDGDHFDLPASKDIINEGFRGVKFSAGKETHYPKMYTVQAVDLVNEVVTTFSYSNKISEVVQARAMVKTFEKNSVTLYDRLHQSYQTTLEHQNAGNYLFVRVQADSPNLALNIKKFCLSNRKTQWIELCPPKRFLRKFQNMDCPKIRVRLIKFRNKKTKKLMVFMTNAPESLIKCKEAGEFYQKRWGIESSFKDITDTLKLCQWHSEKLNGILQEIYALLWLVNNVRRTANAGSPDTRDFLKPKYKKANFKLLATLFIDHLDLLLKGRHLRFNRMLLYWANRSIEKRCHLSRSAPRQVKRHGKKYKNASSVKRRPHN